MSVLSRSLLRSALAIVAFLPLGLQAAEIPKDALHHVKPEACKQCHEEIYQQWQGSMHANSSALKDPIHGAFYRRVAGDPTQEGVTLKAKGTYPVCLKCHAPSAAMDKTTKLDAAPAYENGITCVNCHAFAAFKGNTKPNGKPAYGIDAYHIDAESLHGPTGNTYTTARVADDAKWPTPIHHPVPLKGSNSSVFESNLACMGCHEKRGNAHGTPLCVTGKEYAGANSFVNCQSCHMAVVTVPKLKDGKPVEGEFVSIADHSMGGGHDARMVARGLAMDMETETTDSAIKATITVRNRLPHAFPTGAPFRNFFLKVAAYDKDGNELWKNYQVHPIKDDPKAAFWYTLGDAEGKPVAPPVATQVLADTRLKPNEARTLTYEIPRTAETAIVRAEALYDLLLPPIKASVKGKIPDELLRPPLAASAEMRL